VVWIAATSRLTAPSPPAMMQGSAVETAMFAQELAAEIAIDRVDLDALDDFPMSDCAPSESMMLSDPTCR
jgi:hypothetical protein